MKMLIIKIFLYCLFCIEILEIDVIYFCNDVFNIIVFNIIEIK